MKKILLATSALVVMTGVAVAGDAPAAVAPMAPTADGFTVTATGEVTVFGFTNSNARVLVAVSGVGTVGYSAAVKEVFANGFGAKVDATLKAEKTLDDGATVALKIEYNGNQGASAFIEYSSSIGTFKAGAIKNNTKHGVSDVEAPALGDWLDDDEFIEQTIFAGVSFAPGNAFAGNTWNTRVTYKSPELGGFQLGLGLGQDNFAIRGNVANPQSAFDAVLAGSFAAGDATVKVSAAAAGRSTNFGSAAVISAGLLAEKGDAVQVGASVEIAGFTVGAHYKNVLNGLAAKAVQSYDVGAKYTTNGITAALKYSVADTTNNNGVVSGGLQYDAGDFKVEARGSYNLVITGLTNKYSAQVAAAYTMDAITAVGSVSYTHGGQIAAALTTTTTVTLGVDYALNSNVTVGAGVVYTANTFAGLPSAPINLDNTAAAAGVKVKF